jgi:UDP-galactopyranose mutase
VPIDNTTGKLTEQLEPVSMFDTIIVGSGFAGSVLAERLASQKNKKVLIIEKRNTVAGNCYDCTDEHGVLIHKYGPHLFHTDNKEVFNYLGKFTTWINYQHQVLALVDGQKIPIPFNLNSLSMVFPSSLASSLERKLINKYGFDVKIPILDLVKEEDDELKYLADFIYKKVFANYTAKQWGCSPEEISPEVTARVPVFISRDNRYFQDKYQAIPKQGYTRLFTNILDHENIRIMLNTDCKDVLSFDCDSGVVKVFGQPFSGDFIYTGMIDELFDWRFGELPYRSLQFDFEHLTQDFYQQATTENYPDNYDFTRITEFKRMSGQEIKGTTIVREFPQDYDRTEVGKNTPYYPILNDNNRRRYNQYFELSQQFNNLTLVGRLAEYRYYDMDDIVARALEVYQEKFAT